MSKGKELATVGTVFMYRINVAVASILIFINLQMFIFSFINEDGVTPVTSATVLFVVILYGAWAFNGMGRKYIVYEDALEHRTLFGRWYYMTGDIDKVTFNRKDSTRLRITLDVKGNKKIVINTNSLKDYQALVDFCSRLERG